MNAIGHLVVELRTGAAQLRFQGNVSKPRAPLFEVWARHLEADARSLQLLAEAIDEPVAP